MGVDFKNGRNRVVGRYCTKGVGGHGAGRNAVHRNAVHMITGSRGDGVGLAGTTGNRCRTRRRDTAVGTAGGRDGIFSNHWVRRRCQVTHFIGISTFTTLRVVRGNGKIVDRVFSQAGQGKPGIARITEVSQWDGDARTALNGTGTVIRGAR